MAKWTRERALRLAKKLMEWISAEAGVCRGGRPGVPTGPRRRARHRPRPDRQGATRRPQMELLSLQAPLRALVNKSSLLPPGVAEALWIQWSRLASQTRHKSPYYSGPRWSRHPPRTPLPSPRPTYRRCGPITGWGTPEASRVGWRARLNGLSQVRPIVAGCEVRLWDQCADNGHVLAPRPCPTLPPLDAPLPSPPPSIRPSIPRAGNQAQRPALHSAPQQMRLGGQSE